MIEQLSVMLENTGGSLYSVIRTLGNEKIDIRALTIADTERYGILRIVVDQTEKAIDVLKRNGYVAKITDIICVILEDKPGAFAEVLDFLEKSQTEIEYVYVLGRTGDGKIRMLLRAADNVKTEKLLAGNGYTVLDALQ